MGAQAGESKKHNKKSKTSSVNSPRSITNYLKGCQLPGPLLTFSIIIIQIKLHPNGPIKSGDFAAHLISSHKSNLLHFF